MSHNYQLFLLQPGSPAQLNDPYPHVISFGVEAFKCRLKTLTPIDVWYSKEASHHPGGIIHLKASYFSIRWRDLQVSGMEGPSSATHRKPMNFHMIPMKFRMISSWRRLVSLPWDGSDLWLDRAGHGHRKKHHRKPLRRSECLYDGASWLACFHHFDPCLGVDPCSHFWFKLGAVKRNPAGALSNCNCSMSNLFCCFLLCL